MWWASEIAEAARRPQDVAPLVVAVALQERCHAQVEGVPVALALPQQALVQGRVRLMTQLLPLSPAVRWPGAWQHA